MGLRVDRRELRLPVTNSDNNVWPIQDGSERAVEIAPSVTKPVAGDVETDEGCDHNVGVNVRPLSGKRDVPNPFLEPFPRTPPPEAERFSFGNNHWQRSLTLALCECRQPVAEIGLAAVGPIAAHDEFGWITQNPIEVLRYSLRIVAADSWIQRQPVCTENFIRID